MADYCFQCTRDILGVNPVYNDLAELSKPEDTAKKMYPVVLCEGCGPIQVNHLGICMSDDCLEKGHKHETKDSKGNR